LGGTGSISRRCLPETTWNGAMEEGGPNIDTTRVRAGATPHMTRYILPISLGLIVLILLLLLLVWR
jgi:hypothetical protein